jgi:tetratricopeptide (TPR) repeat protein
MKYWLILLLALPFSTFARKQGQPLIDSLQIALSRAAEDTNRVKLLTDISYSYYVVVPDSGIVYGQKALELASKLGWKKGIAFAHNDIGVSYESKGDHAQALEHYNKALELHEKAGLKILAAGVLTNIAVVYSTQSDDSNALIYYFKALGIYERAHNEQARAMVLENIGTTYMEQKLFDESIQYYNSALGLYKKLEDAQGTASTLMNMGIVLSTAGKYDEALERYSQALAIQTRLGNKSSVQNTLSCMGDAYNHKGDYAKALDYLQRGLAISKEIDCRPGIAVAIGNIGETWFNLGVVANPADKEAIKNAIGYLTDAVTYCKGINFVAPMLEFQEYLSRAYSVGGQYKKAYDLLLEHQVIKDSFFSVESKIQLANIEARRELQLKDKDIQLQAEKLKLSELELAKKHNDQILFIVCLLLLLLATALAVRLFFKYKKSNRVLQKEKEEHLRRIKMHVARIKEQSDLLDEISHTQSHEVRGPVATILGLAHVFNTDDYADPSNKLVIDGITAVAQKLDDTIKEIIKKENDLDGSR